MNTDKQVLISFIIATCIINVSALIVFVIAYYKLSKEAKENKLKSKFYRAELHTILGNAITSVDERVKFNIAKLLSIVFLCLCFSSCNIFRNCNLTFEYTEGQNYKGYFITKCDFDTIGWIDLTDSCQVYRKHNLNNKQLEQLNYFIDSAKPY